jgi:hypothetical protein
VIPVNVAAIYFGLVGGMTGLFWGAGVLTLCPGNCPLVAASAVGADGLTWGACAAFLLSVAGIGGWLLAFGMPRVGGALMVVAGIGSAIAAFPLFVIPGILMLIGGFLRLVVARAQLEPEQVN